MEPRNAGTGARCSCRCSLDGTHAERPIPLNDADVGTTSSSVQQSASQQMLIRLELTWCVSVCAPLNLRVELLAAGKDAHDTVGLSDHLHHGHDRLRPLDESSACGHGWRPGPGRRATRVAAASSRLHALRTLLFSRTPVAIARTAGLGGCIAAPSIGRMSGRRADFEDFDSGFCSPTGNDGCGKTRLVPVRLRCGKRHRGSGDRSGVRGLQQGLSGGRYTARTTRGLGAFSSLSSSLACSNSQRAQQIVRRTHSGAVLRVAPVWSSKGMSSQRTKASSLCTRILGFVPTCASRMREAARAR